MNEERLRELGMDVEAGRKAEGRTQFPTLTACLKCEGINGIYIGPNQNVKPATKQEAYEIALIQYGYYLAKWEGENAYSHPPHICTCKCKHEWEEIDNPSNLNFPMIHTYRCKKCGHIRTVDSSG